MSGLVSVRWKSMGVNDKNHRHSNMIAIRKHQHTWTSRDLLETCLYVGKNSNQRQLSPLQNQRFEQWKQRGVVTDCISHT